MLRLTLHIEHLDRVREKVLLLDENTNKSSGANLALYVCFAELTHKLQIG